MSGLLETKEEKEALKIIRQYAVNKLEEPLFKKPQRIHPQISPEDFKSYQTRYKEINEAYDMLRVQPAVQKITQAALNGQLDA